jgi:hypothetical protein
VVKVSDTVLGRPVASKPNNLLRFLPSVKELVIHPYVHHLNEYFPIESGPSIAKLLTLVLHGPSEGFVSNQVFNMMFKLISGGNKFTFPSLETLCLVGDDPKNVRLNKAAISIEQEMFPTLSTLIVHVHTAALVDIPDSVRIIVGRIANDADWHEKTNLTTAVLIGASAEMNGSHSYAHFLAAMPSSLTALAVSVDIWSSNRPMTQFSAETFISLAPRGLEALSLFITGNAWDDSTHLALKTAYVNVEIGCVHAWMDGLMFLMEHGKILLPADMIDIFFYWSATAKRMRTHVPPPLPVSPPVTDINVNDAMTSSTFQQSAMERLPMTFNWSPSSSTLVTLTFTGKSELGGVYTLFQRETSHHSVKGAMFLTSETRRILSLANPSKVSASTTPTCLFPCLEQCTIQGMILDLHSLKSLASNHLKTLTLMSCALVLPHASRYLEADTGVVPPNAGKAASSSSTLVMLTPEEGKKDDSNAITLPNRRPDQRGLFTNVSLRMCGVVAKESPHSLFRSVGVNHRLAPHSFANVARLVNLVFRTNNGYLTFEANPFLIATSATIKDANQMSASFRTYIESQENVDYDYLLD